MTLTTNPKLNNMYGTLKPEIVKRLQQVLDNPAKYWDDAHSIILRADRKWLTLWQAVIAVDPTFPKRGKATDQRGRVIEDWARKPDSVLIARAIRYAVNERASSATAAT